ncbi:MAG: ABC transporter ATP-binding protein, partial [Thermofilum sp.]
MVTVRLENVSKIFRGGVEAVRDLNLEVKDGEFMVLLGPSGCGKTTTLLMIAGVYKPSKGYIYFDDKIVNDLEPKDRNIGMVFQSYALYPHMTVYENIAFPLRLKKLPKEEIDRRVREAASMLRIENLLDRRPSQLSGGQQQRVALARAIVKRPSLFLMDEPLSNLDAKIRVEVRAELKRLQRELGITTIYVTHDQAEAMSLADRIAVMNEGRLQQVGTPDELYYKPANTFVAGFIGAPAA